jgi:ribose/xylose/arabinose/galactoside ABC-type transport system permease subunit
MLIVMVVALTVLIPLLFYVFVYAGYAVGGREPAAVLAGQAGRRKII